MQGNNLSMVFLVLYLVTGLYFINSALSFIAMPEFILQIEKWIMFASGILLIFGGINYKRASKKYY